VTRPQLEEYTISLTKRDCHRAVMFELCVRFL